MGEIEFEMKDLEEINKFLETPSLESQESFEEAVGRINESLKDKESGIKLSIDQGKLSFYNGTEEIKFGSKKQSYSDYIKENFKDIETRTNANGDPLSVAQLETISSTMATDIAKGLYGDKVSSTIVEAFNLQLKVETSPQLIKYELRNGWYGDYHIQLEPSLAEGAISSSSNSSGPSGTPKEPAQAVAKKVIASSKPIEGLQSRSPAEIETGIDKVFDEKLKNAKSEWEKEGLEKDRTTFKDVLKYGLVGLAGFFTYEMIAAHAAFRSGCFVTTTDQKTGQSTVCKLPILTCDQEAAASGTLCQFNVDKGWCMPAPKGGTLFPEGCRPCSDGIGDACNTCGGGDSKCSKYCNNSYMVTSMNGKNYDYTCVTCDMKCGLNDLSNKVTDILSKVGDSFGGILDLFNNILKYGLYFIIGFIVLYCLYWLISFFGKKGDKENRLEVSVQSSPAQPSLAQKFGQSAPQLNRQSSSVPPPLSFIPPVPQGTPRPGPLSSLLTPLAPW